MKKHTLALIFAPLAAVSLGLSACGAGPGEGIPGVPGLGGQSATSAPTAPAPSLASPSPSVPGPEAPSASVPAPTDPSVPAPEPTQPTQPTAQQPTPGGDVPTSGKLNGAQLDALVQKLVPSFERAQARDSASTTRSTISGLESVSRMDASAVDPATCGDAMVNTGMKVTGTLDAAGVIFVESGRSGNVVYYSTDDPTMFTLMKDMYANQSDKCSSYSISSGGNDSAGGIASFEPQGLSGDVVFGFEQTTTSSGMTLVQTGVFVSRGELAASAILTDSEASPAVQQAAVDAARQAIDAAGR